MEKITLMWKQPKYQDKNTTLQVLHILRHVYFDLVKVWGGDIFVDQRRDYNSHMIM